jgi:RNA recognition motif-containing protein
MNLYIGNIPYSISESELTALFANFGEVTSLNIVKDKVTNRSKGFGFVDMPDDSAANAAIAELNGKEVNGRKIIVNEARPKADKPRFNKHRD